MGFTNTPTLETERLLLRRFSENDLYTLFKIHSDKDVTTYLPWFPLQSIEEANLFLRERYLDTYRQPYGYKYAICLKNDNIPIGYVNIDINEPHDLGYGLLKAFWRNVPPHFSETRNGGFFVLGCMQRSGLLQALRGVMQNRIMDAMPFFPKAW